ncbi:MAG: DUF5700 domain-containing putative Zn-dependent protease [Acidobacteriota bacterium]
MAMRKIAPFYFLSLLFLLVLIFYSEQVNVSAQRLSDPRVNVHIVTDEADAVLSILAKKENGQEIEDTDWQRVLTSEGYIRLQKRERSMQRRFEDADFKTFVLSDNLVKNRHALADTLSRWKETDVEKIAERPLAYLPKNAFIKAKIYPVIKPRENSFVFDIPNDPAIFLYLAPNKSKEIFENEFAHELHHIGYGTACPMQRTAVKLKELSPAMQEVMKWLGAFGEGFAMLAAAGGVDVHPHEFSLPADRARWDKDVANFNNDLKTVEKFLLDLATGKLDEKSETNTARSFYGVQGAWYTVGWQMAVVIEKTFGRAKLVECMCDERKLASTYNRGVKKYNRRDHRQLASWSKDFIDKFR